MHKTFISYHHKGEQDIKDELVQDFGAENFIDASVGDGEIDRWLPEDTIMRQIRENYLHDSTVTLVLVGWETAQRPFVNSEIQASLRDTSLNNHNGLLAVVRDDLYNVIFTPGQCASCRCNIRVINSQNYKLYLPNLVYQNHIYHGTKCHYSDDDVYCGLMSYSTFKTDPEKYIDSAFDKRSSHTITIYKTAEAGTPMIGRR